MSRPYSAKTFLRQTPNDLLQKYFTSRRIDLNLEWVRLYETDINPIILALEKIPDRDRAQVDSDFLMINELACGNGVEAILEGVNGRTDRKHDNLADKFAAMKNNHERALWTFLHHPELIQLANCIYDMDRYGGWKKRFVGYRLQISNDSDDLKKFEDGLRFLYRKQARGRFCHVDYYIRHDPIRHCYFAYPEDYASTDMGYDDHGRLVQRPRRSALEIIFVYRPEEGILETRAKGKKQQIEELEGVFATAILKLVKLPDENKQLPYDLEPLKSRHFKFKTDPADMIDSVFVRQLRFDLPGGEGKRITVSANSSPYSPQALHDFLDEAINEAKLSLRDLRVSHAKLRFAFKSTNGHRPKSLTFDITYPDRCTLKDDSYDQVAKKYLWKWGLANE